ncbi:class I SAM-dependent methyltransferase [Paractinoplanes atraurantiacus]|nr:class I SAM-dependent methyltransferase [Actinoplanes atraurantiacus]
MVNARYDAVAEFYDAGFSDLDDPVLRALLRLAGPVDGLRVLDLACGHGRVSRELAGLGAHVTGVDLSSALLAKARAAGPPSIRYVHANAADMDELPDGSFEAVVCNFGLSDIDDLGGALAEVGRVLRATLRRQVGANHRTLSTYVDELSRNGLWLAAMSEPPAPESWKSDPVRREAARLPVFLVARCVRRSREI